MYFITVVNPLVRYFYEKIILKFILDSPNFRGKSQQLQSLIEKLKDYMMIKYIQIYNEQGNYFNINV